MKPTKKHSISDAPRAVKSSRKTAPKPPLVAAVGGFERITLIATIGTSPAVLTETIWELAGRDGIIPDDVVVVTTGKGREELLRHLFALDANGAPLPNPTPDVPCIWDQLRASLAAEGHELAGRLCFGNTADHLIAYSRQIDGRMRERNDIQDEADHNAFANCVLGQLLRHTASPARQVIVSIAGGFKTMSALMLSCMTLVGRTSDRVNHILVKNGNCRDFFFPKQQRQEVEWSDPVTFTKTKGLAKDAQLLLLDVPLATFHDLFDRDFRDDAPSYADLVRKCQERARAGAALLGGRMSVGFLDDMQMRLSVANVEFTLQRLRYWVFKAVLLAVESLGEKSRKWRDLADAASAGLAFLPENSLADGSTTPGGSDVSKALTDIAKALKEAGLPLPGGSAVKRPLCFEIARG